MKKATGKAVQASPRKLVDATAASSTGAAPASFSASDYPQLQEFLRAYLHEDYKEENGSVSGALDEFCYSATKRERAALKRDLDAFLLMAAKKPFDRVRDWWTTGLGSAWLPPDNKALLALQTELNQADTDKQR